MQELVLRLQLPVGSVLPVQLQQLHLQAWYSSDAVSVVLPLQQLQRLSLAQGFTEHQPLLQLAQLPALQHLSVEYTEAHVAAAGAAVWLQLPQLRELEITFGDEAPLPSHIAAILDVHAACTQLTRLHLEAVQSLSEEYAYAQPVAACSKLAGLKNLRNLCIAQGSKLVPKDVRALTALTGLTQLVLSGLESAVDIDDVAATALACSLKQLQHLDLSDCTLGGMVCLAAIGQLTQLTGLHFSGLWMNREDLMLLTGLSRLQQLEADMCIEDENTFWATVRPSS
jgi:Leucine-rich repeat (LRR) protein